MNFMTFRKYMSLEKTETHMEIVTGIFFFGMAGKEIINKVSLQLWKTVWV